MNATRYAKTTVAFAICGLTAACIVGCSAPQSNTVATANDADKVAEINQRQADKAVNGVAAKVYGRQITEQQVADYISQYRTYAGLTNDSDWATFIDQNGTSAESIREDAIKFFITRYTIDNLAEEKGITVSDEEVSEVYIDIQEIPRVKSSSQIKTTNTVHVSDENGLIDALKRNTRNDCFLG